MRNDLNFLCFYLFVIVVLFIIEFFFINWKFGISFSWLYEGCFLNVYIVKIISIKKILVFCLKKNKFRYMYEI